jgi:uncharacterized protein YndB with AHSA1/START domain
MEKQKFVYVTYINTTPEQLWAALTQSEFTKKYWFDSSIESEWKIGSPVRFRRNGEVTDDQILLRCEPPRLLAYTWHPIFDAELRAEKPSRVTFEIEAPGEKSGSQNRTVKLTVTHDDFPAGSKMFPRISNGWPAVLSGLKSLLENGAALELGPPCCAAKDKTATAA